MLFYFIFLCFFSIFYGYYNFLLVILVLEFFLLLSYFFSLLSSSIFLMGFIFCMVLMCFLVLEAILGLNLIIINYRYFGVSFFNLW